MLASYYAQHGKYPEKVAFMLWATNSIQDKGVMEAEILYLMGLKPTRDSNGNVNGTVAINNLGRPVIDVVVTTTSLYLNDFQCVLDVINNAIKKAYTLNGTNYVKIHSDSIYQMLKAKGYDNATALSLSQSRIFSQEPGNHHNPLTEVTLADSGDNMQAVIDTFVNTFGYLYGQNVTSSLMVDLYTAILNGSDLAVFNRNVNANDLIGDDDYYAYFGGLGASISKITGKSPTMIINNLGNPNNPKTETLSESIARDLRTTYFNPLWIKEMMNMGPGGPSRFIDVTNLLAWDLLNPGTVTSNQFQQIYDNYVKDSQNLGLNDYFQKYNPYTQQAIMYNLLQSIHSNRWNADAATKRDLANQFANSVIKNGWSGDPLDMEIVNEWLNSMDAKYVERVKSKLYASTMNSAFAPSNPQNPSNPQETNPQDGGSSSDGGSSAPGQTSSGVSYAAAASPSSGQSSAGSSGQKAYEVSKTSQGSSKDNENYVYAIVGLIALMGLIGFGYFKGVGRN